jgi:hypothetical protein
MNSELKVLTEQAAKGIVDNLFGQDIPCIREKAWIGEAISERLSMTHFSESEKAMAKSLLEEVQAEGFDAKRIFAAGVALGRKILNRKYLVEKKEKEIRPINKKKTAIINALKESAARSARLVAIYPDRILLESDGRYFECRYVVTDEEKVELFGPVEEMEPRFYPKKIAGLIEEQLESEAKVEVFNLKVAGVYVPPPLEPIKIDEATLTESDLKNRRIAGLM